MALTWPKIPKVEDVVTVVTALDARVSAIEATANSNKARLDALDAFKGSHSAGADHREREIASLKEQLDRERWLTKLKRR